MFSKLALVTSALTTTSALHHRTKVQAVQQTCSYNFDRMFSPKGQNDFNQFSNKGTPYEDSEFPADASSLVWEEYPWKDDAKKNTEYVNEITGWARPSELTPSPSLWGSKGVTPNGTDQGGLGDCWFLASASALAEHPERIKQIFTNTKYDSAGCFQVTFYLHGQPVKITIDDRLPIYEGMDPGYTNYGVKKTTNAGQGLQGSWWQALLEKAYAKFNVNYLQLVSGQEMTALRELTNMPVHMYDVEDVSDQEMFDQIMEADRKQYTMTAGCYTPHHNLVTGHAYTLLGAIELTNGPKLLKVRNPWGKERYDGPFSDDDPQWTDAWKQEAGLVQENDGVFHIPLEGFRTAFGDYTILYYQDWYRSVKNVTGTGKAFKFHMKSEVDQSVIIEINYLYKRHVPKGCAMDDVRYNIYFDDGPAHSVSKYQSYGTFFYDLKAGQEHMWEVYNWNDATVDGDYTMTIFSPDSKVAWV